MSRVSLLFFGLVLSFGAAWAQPQPSQPPAPSGILGGLDLEPETPPPARPATGPPPTPGQQAPLFPALAGCEQGLAGLSPGTREATVAALDRRIAFWNAQSFEAIVLFRHPGQAEYALACFQRRLALLSAFAPENEERAAAREAARAVNERWGSRLETFLTGEAEGANTDEWWQQADAAFEEIARLEVTLSRAAAAPDPERAPLIAAARSAVAELAETIESVKGFQDTLDATGRAFWLRALTWRARQAGLAIDTLHQSDLERDPELAYALLTRPATDEPPTAETVLAGDLAAFLQRLRRLREARRDLDPAAPRDWSQSGSRRVTLEEIYLINYMAQTIGQRIDERLRDQADTMKLRLQLTHQMAVWGGMAEAESQALRDAEWAAFRAQQADLRDGALQRWEAQFTSLRVQRVLQGPRLGGAGAR